MLDTGQIRIGSVKLTIQFINKQTYRCNMKKKDKYMHPLDYLKKILSEEEDDEEREV